MAPKKKQIDAYDGYGKPGRLYAYGRIVKSRKQHVDYAAQSALYNLWESIRRIFVTVVEDEKLLVRVGESKKELETNSEGYYRIDWEVAGFEGKIPTDTVHLEMEDVSESEVECRIYCDASKAKYGVISDIDDTILVTKVNDLISAAYYSVFVSPRKRKSIKGASRWYRHLHRRGDMSLFYLSNSPWNLYYYLQNFLLHYRYPKGPIMLRDFGLKKKDDLQDFGTHKKNEIHRLLEFYPDLEFILIGDGGEHDADTYLDINAEYPDRIKSIFVYRLGDREKQERIEKLSEGVSKFHFIHDAAEGEAICKQLGLY